MEKLLAENSRRIETLQKEVEQEKKTRADQQKTIADLKGRMKGNIILSEARGIIWSDIISAVMEQWGFLRTMGENKSAMPYLNRKLQEADLNLSVRALHAKNYISLLKELEYDDAEKHGIPSRFMEVFEFQKIIDKEAARVTASRALQQVVENVGRFDVVWGEITTAGLSSSWDPTTPSVL